MTNKLVGKVITLNSGIKGLCNGMVGEDFFLIYGKGGKVEFFKNHDVKKVESSPTADKQEDK